MHATPEAAKCDIEEKNSTYVLYSSCSYKRVGLVNHVL